MSVSDFGAVAMLRMVGLGGRSKAAHSGIEDRNGISLASRIRNGLYQSERSGPTCKDKGIRSVSCGLLTYTLIGFQEAALDHLKSLSILKSS